MTKKLKHTIPPALKCYPTCGACKHMVSMMRNDACAKHNVVILPWYGCADYAPYQTEMHVAKRARAERVMPIAPVTK